MQIRPDNICSHLTAPEGQAVALNAQEQKIEETARFIFSRTITGEGKPLEKRSNEEIKGYIDRAVDILTDKQGKLLNDPNKLPILFGLAIEDKESPYREQLSDIYKRLCKFAYDQKLDPEVIPTIVQDTEKAVRDRLIDIKNEEEKPHFDLELGGNTTSINLVALYAMSKPFYLIAEGADLRGISEGVGEGATPKIEGLLPEGVEAIKTYVETRKLPNLSERGLDFLISTYNFLETYQFPDEIRDHFIARIIDVLAVEEERENQFEATSKAAEYEIKFGGQELRLKDIPIPAAVDRIRAFKYDVDSLKDIHSALLPISDAVVAKALPALIDVSDRQKKIDILQTIALLPEAEVAENTGIYLKYLFSHASIEANTTAVLAQLKTLPHPRLRYIALAVIRLMLEEGKNIDTFRYVVSRLKKISDPTNNEALISTVKSTVKTFFAFGQDRLNEITQAFDAIQNSQKSVETYLHILQVCRAFNTEVDRRYILKVINAIDREERADFIKHALGVLSGITRDWEKVRILEVISAIDRKERADIINNAEPVLRGITSGQEKVGILEAVKRIEPEERTDVVDNALGVLSGIQSGWEKVDILKVINAIDRKERADVVNNALGFLRGIQGGRWKVEILKAINAIDRKERADVVNNALRVLSGITSGQEKVGILEAVKSIEPEERADVVNNALGLLRGVQDGEEKVKILEAVKSIELEERADVVDNALGFLSDITSVREKLEILKAIRAIDRKERADVVNNAEPVLRGIQSGRGKVEILKAIRAIDRKERADVVNNALGLLRGVQDGEEKVKILEAVKSIELEERADIINNAEPVLRGIQSGRGKVEILEAVKRIKPQERADVINNALRVLSGITSAREKLEILKVINAIDRKERADVVNNALRVLSGIEYGWEIVEILEAIRAIDRRRRADFIDKALRVQKDTPNRMRVHILLAIKDINSRKRAKVIEEAARREPFERLAFLRNVVAKRS